MVTAQACPALHTGAIMEDFFDGKNQIVSSVQGTSALLGIKHIGLFSYVSWTHCISKTFVLDHFNMASNDKRSPVELRTFKLYDNWAVLEIDEQTDSKLDSFDYETDFDEQ